MARPLSILEAPAPDAIPEHAMDFLRALGGPAWIRLPGLDSSRCRAVATLLHGNEPSGLRAVHARLRRGAPPAVDTVVFVGAVEAARAAPGFAHRALPGRPDLNRCFREPFALEEGALAREVLRRLDTARPEALIDLHNNTGHNPPYGVGPAARAEELHLTSLFGSHFVRSGLALGALVEATADAFPSATIECGRAGDPAADAVARRGLDRFLDAERLFPETEAPPGVRVLEDPVRVRVRPGLRLRFADRPDPDVDVTVTRDADRHNFALLAPGVRIGWLGSRGEWPLEAAGADGRDVSTELFEARDGALLTRRAAIPIMMTTDPVVAISDCLFYVVEPAS